MSMEKTMKTIWMGLGFLTLALGQDTAPQRITMPFRDATAPRKLIVDGLIGGVTVKGYDGKDAIIEYTGRGGVFAFGRSSAPAPAGMRRIGPTNADLNVTEENNVITVHGGPFGRTDLTIQVPVETSVTANSFAGGSITIENISGEMEASNMAGPVTITNASGSVVAHSMSGKVTVSLNKVTPDKTMSFSTMNGDIEVTLPANTKARLKTKTFNGDIFVDTDFDVKMEAPSNAVVEDQVEVRDKNGKTKTKTVRRRRVDEATYGTINGGGPEFQFTTFNGRILIHKK
jgi:hypothetical protein